MQKFQYNFLGGSWVLFVLAQVFDVCVHALFTELSIKPQFCSFLFSFSGWEVVEV